MSATVGCRSTSIRGVDASRCATRRSGRSESRRHATVLTSRSIFGALPSMHLERQCRPASVLEHCESRTISLSHRPVESSRRSPPYGHRSRAHSDVECARMSDPPRRRAHSAPGIRCTTVSIGDMPGSTVRDRAQVDHDRRDRTVRHRPPAPRSTGRRLRRRGSAGSGSRRRAPQQLIDDLLRPALHLRIAALHGGEIQILRAGGAGCPRTKRHHRRGRSASRGRRAR